MYPKVVWLRRWIVTLSAFLWLFFSVCFQMSPQNPCIRGIKITQVAYSFLIFNVCVSNVSSKCLHSKMQSRTDGICLAFLYCGFSNVSSNRLPEKRHNHIRSQESPRGWFKNVTWLMGGTKRPDPKTLPNDASDILMDIPTAHWGMKTDEILRRKLVRFPNPVATDIHDLAKASLEQVMIVMVVPATHWRRVGETRRWAAWTRQGWRIPILPDLIIIFITEQFIRMQMMWESWQCWQPGALDLGSW